MTEANDTVVKVDSGDRVGSADQADPAERVDGVNRVDWGALWASGDLARFCFVSLGILLHATNETMVATIMPAMINDLSGVQLVGWSLAIYELGSICAGAAAGRLVARLSLRTTMIAAALLYAAGAAVCAAAPTMPAFLAGRLLEGFGGGGLVAVAFVAVERLFDRRIWPQLFAIISAVWGVAAFSGPLLGAVIAEAFSWRTAFGVFAVGGLVMALATASILRGPGARARGGKAAAPFPYPALLTLAVAITLIAVAGVSGDTRLSALLIVGGLAGLALFFAIDARRPASRLFPGRLFDWRTPVGSGMTVVFAFSIATCSFALYGPLILTSLHGTSVLTTGYIIAAESIAWSILSILVANAPPYRERLIIIGGCAMVAAGVVGFAFAVPSGSIPLILGCAVLQGGGFGIAWPFVTRIIVSAAPVNESTVASSAVPTMQRIGYAVGSALCGIIANYGGFSDGLAPETAKSVAFWLFTAFIPVAAVGFVASVRNAAAVTRSGG